AEVCPADAIKRTADGIVQSARKPRCIACNNCVLACPFGIPKMNSGMNLMMKCDMCYDRTSVGKKPMCASVCPSGALYFGTLEEIERLRPSSRPINTFQFGLQRIRTRVFVMVPKHAPLAQLDVTGALLERATGLPGRLASRRVRGAPRLHEVHGADQPGLRGGAVLDPVPERVAAADGRAASATGRPGRPDPGGRIPGLRVSGAGAERGPGAA